MKYPKLTVGAFYKVSWDDHAGNDDWEDEDEAGCPTITNGFFYLGRRSRWLRFALWRTTWLGNKKPELTQRHSIKFTDIRLIVSDTGEVIYKSDD